jgi:uncharacterized protein YggE
MIEIYKIHIAKVVIGVGVLLGIFLAVESFYTYKQTSTQGNSSITVSGTGKVEKAPDTARVSFTIEDIQKTLAPAQQNVSQKVDKVTSALLEKGISKDAITTDSYSSAPEYTYPQNVCTPNGCNNPNPILKGYKVSHNITIKIKDITKTDDVLGVLGIVGVNNISGPNFGFDDDKVVAREARDMAILDAHEEAEKLARALHVHLGRVISFNEGSSQYPIMMNARADMATGAAPMAKDISIPAGSQKVESTVSITYEIQ